MPQLITADGTPLFYKDWAEGRPIVFCHGWPLNADSWEGQMTRLAGLGYRCLAHDRRGHGRSPDTWQSHGMDCYADDLAALLERLDLRDAVLVGHGCGAGEVARYIGRHGTARVAAVALISTVTPTLKGGAAGASVPAAVWDSLRTAARNDAAELYRQLAAGPYFGFNRPGASISPATMLQFCLQARRTSLHAALGSLTAFSREDFRRDLAAFDKPTLLIHGEDDQVLPMQATAVATARLLPAARLLPLPGAPHGLLQTHDVQVGDALGDFLARGR